MVSKKMPVNPDLIRKNIELSKRGVRIRVFVKPGSNETKLVAEEDELVFYTEEPPVAGRANASLIRFIARAIRISPSKITIVRGLRDRLKIVEIQDVDLEEIVNSLSNIAEPW